MSAWKTACLRNSAAAFVGDDAQRLKIASEKARKRGASLAPAKYSRMFAGILRMTSVSATSAFL